MTHRTALNYKLETTRIYICDDASRVNKEKRRKITGKRRWYDITWKKWRVISYHIICRKGKNNITSREEKKDKREKDVEGDACNKLFNWRIQCLNSILIERIPNILHLKFFITDRSLNACFVCLSICHSILYSFQLKFSANIWAGDF
jgi:hypothetical protein